MKIENISIAYKLISEIYKINAEFDELESYRNLPMQSNIVLNRGTPSVRYIELYSEEIYDIYQKRLDALAGRSAEIKNQLREL